MYVIHGLKKLLVLLLYDVCLHLTTQRKAVRQIHVLFAASYFIFTGFADPLRSKVQGYHNFRPCFQSFRNQIPPPGHHDTIIKRLAVTGWVAEFANLIMKRAPDPSSDDSICASYIVLDIGIPKRHFEEMKNRVF